MSEAVEKLVWAILDNGDSKFLMQHPEISDYVQNNSFDASLFATVDQHIKKHGKAPALSTVEAACGEKLSVAEEPPSFYLEIVRKAHVRKTLQGAAMEAQQFIKDDPEKALDTVEKACLELRRQRQGLSAIDLREAKDTLVMLLKQKFEGTTMRFGWPTLDKMSNGIMPGDFDVIAGRRGLGKTYCLLSRAFHFWETGHRVAFLSNEMNLPQILERAAAIQGQVPADYLKFGMFPNLKVDFKKKLSDAMDAAKTAAQGFWLFDGGAVADHADVYRICSQVRPDVLCIDAAYLLAGSSYSDRWQRIAESATFLKLTICPKVPVLATYQFTARSLKEAKKKNSMDPDDLDVAGSQEIGNLASVMLGLYQSEDPEAVNRRKVSVLKGRYGETGMFEIEWNFFKMAFGEVMENGQNDFI